MAAAGCSFAFARPGGRSQPDLRGNRHGGGWMEAAACARRSSKGTSWAPVMGSGGGLQPWRQVWWSCGGGSGHGSNCGGRVAAGSNHGVGFPPWQLVWWSCGGRVEACCGWRTALCGLAPPGRSGWLAVALGRWPWRAGWRRPVEVGRIFGVGGHAPREVQSGAHGWAWRLPTTIRRADAPFVADDNAAEGLRGTTSRFVGWLDSGRKVCPVFAGAGDD